MLISIYRINKASKPARSSLQLIIFSRIRLASVVSWSRLKIADSEVGKVFISLIRVSVYFTDLSSLKVSSIIYIIDKETLLSIRKAAIQFVEMVI